MIFLNYSYIFKGTKFAVYGHYGPEYGKFIVEFDGVVVKEIDENFQSQKYALLYESDNYNYKEHVVRFI